MHGVTLKIGHFKSERNLSVKYVFRSAVGTISLLFPKAIYLMRKQINITRTMFIINRPDSQTTAFALIISFIGKL